MNDHADIEIRIKSQTRYVCLVRRAVEETALSMGMAEQTAAQMALAIDEAIANIIKHGYSGEEQQPIWVKMSQVEQNGQSGMEIVVEDECQGVDLSQIKGRPLEQVRPGGLGVHLIRGIMDEVEYSHRENGSGVRLRMCKFIAPDQLVNQSSRRKPSYG